MEMDRRTNVPIALYHAELGHMVSAYVERIHPAVIESAIEKRAVRTLEAIRQILEDDALDDPECFQRIDALVSLYHRELNIPIDRHSEYE